MNHDVMLIGPACRDENIDYDGTVVRGVGGAVFFCDFAVRASGADVFSAVKINEKDTDIIDSFETDSSHIALLPSRLTTLMRNTYTTPTRETRIAECQHYLSPGRPALRRFPAGADHGAGEEGQGLRGYPGLPAPQ